MVCCGLCCCKRTGCAEDRGGGSGEADGEEEGNDLTGIMQCIFYCGAVPLTQLLSETWFNLHIHFERAFSLKLLCG